MRYEILENFPTEWADSAKTEWLNQKNYILNLVESLPEGKTALNELDNFSSVSKFENNNFHLVINRKKLSGGIFEELSNIEGAPISVLFFCSGPGRVDKFHTDSCRSSAINFPIVVDHKKSFFKIGLNENIDTYDRLGDLKPEWLSEYEDKKEKGHYVLDKFEAYNLSKPILFNCKLPHGGENYSDDFRVICSISFHQSFVDIVDRMLERWK